MVNAQEWLDKNYPKKIRNKIIKLNINDKNLEGWLILEDFDKLEIINCSSNEITGLEFINLKELKELICHSNQLVSLETIECNKLTKISCANNQLTDVNFLSNLKNPEKLTHLDISNNNINEQGLSFLKKLTNLEYLYLENENKGKIWLNTYNRFVGSVNPLKDLTKLKEFNIVGTNIDISPQDIKDFQERLNRFDYDELPRKKIGAGLEQNQQLKKYNYLIGVLRWSTRSLAVSGGILAIKGYPVIGGSIGIVSPFIETTISYLEKKIFEENEKEVIRKLEENKSSVDLSQQEEQLETQIQISPK